MVIAIRKIEEKLLENQLESIQEQEKKHNISSELFLRLKNKELASNILRSQHNCQEKVCGPIKRARKKYTTGRNVI